MDVNDLATPTGNQEETRGEPTVNEVKDSLEDPHRRNQTMTFKTSDFVKSKLHSKSKDEGLTPSAKLHLMAYNEVMRGEEGDPPTVNETLAVEANQRLTKERDMLKDQVIKQQEELHSLRPQKGKVFVDGAHIHEKDFKLYQFLDAKYKNGETAFNESELPNADVNPWSMPNSGAKKIGPYIMRAKYWFWTEDWYIEKVA